MTGTFNRPTAADLEIMTKICPGRTYSGEEINEDYTHDEMKIYGQYMPDIVAEVLSADEVSSLLAYCNMRRIAVTPRGAGTGLCGGSVAIYGGLLISLIKMNHVLDIDRDNMTVTLEPGVLLMDLIEILDKENLFYPPDPGEKSATIGGNIMTNAGGMRAVKYGVTRDYVRGITAVLADGSVVDFGGKPAKNSSGLSLKDLLIGSEGTLAIVTKAVLKVLPKPPATYSGLAPFPSIEAAIATVPSIISAGLGPTAVEFMQKEVVGLVKEYLGKTFPDTKAPAYLLISVEAENDNEAELKMDRFAELLVKLGAEDVFFADTDERRESLW
ncbi:MAG: FAD-binding oxidoreductase, partial [Clostridiales bacterium]|nr:FAD-binding oxidoreductase [Clostridiales bacterium]